MIKKITQMKIDNHYVTPCVYKRTDLLLETVLLQTSIVGFIGQVESTGQHVHDFEWNNSQPYFNHNWDE